MTKLELFLPFLSILSTSTLNYYFNKNKDYQYASFIPHAFYPIVKELSVMPHKNHKLDN